MNEYIHGRFSIIGWNASGLSQTRCLWACLGYMHAYLLTCLHAYLHACLHTSIHECTITYVREHIIYTYMDLLTHVHACRAYIPACLLISRGPAIKYVTLFWTNFDLPPSVTHCHTSREPPKVSHTSRNLLPNF